MFLNDQGIKSSLLLVSNTFCQSNAPPSFCTAHTPTRHIHTDTSCSLFSFSALNQTKQTQQTFSRLLPLPPIAHTSCLSPSSLPARHFCGICCMCKMILKYSLKERLSSHYYQGTRGIILVLNCFMVDVSDDVGVRAGSGRNRARVARNWPEGGTSISRPSGVPVCTLEYSSASLSCMPSASRPANNKMKKKKKKKEVRVRMKIVKKSKSER